MELIGAAGLAVAGALAGPRIRAVVLRHSVVGSGATRSDCPTCRFPLLAGGPGGLLAVLPGTGRCPHCRTGIGPPAGSVELTGAIALPAMALWGRVPVLAGCLLVAAAIALIVIDAQVHRLPDAITLPTAAGMLLALAAAGPGWPDPGAAPRAALGAVAMAGGFWLLAAAGPTGLGVGDGKLALSLGAGLGWVGWPALLTGAVLGVAGAALYGLAVVVVRGGGLRRQFPLGPFLLVGALVVLVRP